MASEMVRTTAKLEVVNLEHGGRAYVKRAGEGRILDVCRAAQIDNPTQMSVVDSLNFRRWMCRATVVSIEGMIHMASKQAVEFYKFQHPLLGQIADDEFFEALSQSDRDSIVNISAGVTSAQKDVTEGN